jgi:HlyD family secretion protein
MNFPFAPFRPKDHSPSPSEPARAGMDRSITRPPKWRRFLLPAVAVAVMTAAAAWLLAGPRGSVYRVPVNQLTIATVKRGPFEDFIAVRGSVAPLITSYLTTEQGGTVKQVLVEDGTMVRKGQPLILLSNPTLQLQVAAQQLAFEQTRFKYEHDLLDIDHEISRIKNNLERDKRLLDGKAIAPSVYHQEENDYAYNIKLRAALVASRDVEQKVRTTQLLGGNGESGGAIASAGVDALTIRAPMDGQLGALDAEVGQAKPQGAVLGQVNSADRFKLTAQVDEFYLGRVNPGQQTLYDFGRVSREARVAKVYPQVSNGTFKADFYFNGAAPIGVRVGQAMDLKIELGGASNVLMLPNGPFYQDSGGNWVFVLAPDGHSAIKRTVRLGRRNPQFVEIVDGLSANEKVIVSGYEAFQKMDRVEFQNLGTGN